MLLCIFMQCVAEKLLHSCEKMFILNLYSLHIMQTLQEVPINISIAVLAHSFVQLYYSSSTYFFFHIPLKYGFFLSLFVPFILDILL